MKGRCKKKKTIIIILCVIIYMIAGAIAPFVLQKDVSEKFKNQFFLTISGAIVVIFIASICLFASIRISI